jgi:hypothetical protein
MAGYKMAIIVGRNCPLCGVYIKPENITRHIDRVHPRYSEDALRIPVVRGKCPLCGKVNDPSKTRNNLSICDAHYVKDVRPFLIKNFYIKLKERNTAELAAEPNAAFWMIKLQLSSINALLGWTPEEVGEQQFLAFNEVSAYTGYLLLRLLEAAPSICEKMFAYAESEKHLMLPRKFEQVVGRLLMLTNAEFELFQGIKLGANGYYDIAVDDELSPKFVMIVPSLEPKSVNRLLLFLLRDANEQWHGTFRKILVPSGTSSAHDEFGASFSFNRSLIKDHFDVFKACWNEVFGTDTKMTALDFEKLWDWLDWVVASEGITANNQTKATYFEDYVNFGLDKTLVFQTLGEVLPEAHDCLDIVSLKTLVQQDLYLRTHFDLANIARGFKMGTPKGFVYYFPCRKWFYNKIMPVLVKFTRQLQLAGPSFEKDMNTFSSFYSKRGVTIGGKSSLGYMIEPHLKEPSQKLKTSQNMPWQVLEKNYQIQLGEPDSAKLGKTGEIDLIVYANMNLCLIELKAISLENRHAIKYLREKAPVQCAKYSSWVRNRGVFVEFLKKHNIRENQLKSVRVLICSSGIFRDLNATCLETGEHFAIVTEFVLFSTMGGFFTLSLKNPFPERVKTLSAGLRITDENVSQVAIFDNSKELRQRISNQLILWKRLITFDRRRAYKEVQIGENEAKGVSFLETGYLVNEAYIANTASWLLPTPLLIGKANNYSFYAGTQVGNAGTTIVCPSCRSAIKYYSPDDDDEALQRIKEIFASL